MTLLRSAHRAFSVTFDGIREALVVVAERVALQVQAAKLLLHAEDAEARLRHAYQSLGQHLYGTHHATSPEVGSVEAALSLTARIRTEQQLVRELRDQLASLNDETLAVPLRRLQEDLKGGGGTIERVTISPGSQADGKRLVDLQLPPTVRLVAVRRGQTLVIPVGSLVLQAGDDITLLGSRSSVAPALLILRT
ncbi:MAG: TrkA C-terminal domain-containing protein [Nitrospirota bacterium]